MREEKPISLAAYPALRIALCFGAGIWLGSLSGISVGTSLIAVLFCLSLSWGAGQVYRRDFTRLNWRRLSLMFYLLSVIAAGIFWYTYTNHQPIPEHHQFAHSESRFTLHGTILESTQTSGGFPRVTLRVDSLNHPSYPVWTKSFKTEAYGTHTSQFRDLAFGHNVTVSADFDSVAAPSNPHQFDYRSFLERRDIHLIASIQEIESSQPVTKRNEPVYWQRQTRNLIGRIFTEEQIPLARAVMLGDRSQLEDEARTAFTRAGLAHLMAVSGMHVGFLMAPVWMLIPFFWRFRSGNTAAFVFCLLVLAAYCIITGFSVSVIRASLMAALLMYARCYQKQSDGLNLLGAAGLIMLLLDPMYLFDVGFQLSFAAVAIILTTLPASREILPVKWRHTKTAKLYQFVMVSVLVQAGLFPILIHYFNEYSIIGPLSNTIAVPLIQIMFTLSMINLGIATFAPGFAAFLNTPSDAILWLADFWVSSVAGHSASWISGNLPGSWFFVLWAAGIVAFATIHRADLRWKCLNLLLILLASLSIYGLWNKWTPSEIMITVFDVGQADAILVEGPGDTSFFYDTGLKSWFHDSGQDILEPELKARGITHIDAIIHSHPHADHIGGTSHLINEFSVGRIYQPDFEHDSQVYTEMLETARDHDIPVEDVRLGDKIDITPELRLYVLAPHERLSGSDPNIWSAVVKLQYGETSVLLAGDATARTERYLSSDYGSFLDSELLKVGHHGSSTSSTPEFLEAVDPEKSVASLGLENRYNHPHPEAAEHLLSTETMLRYTSLEGAIQYISNGRELHYHDWR